MIVSVIIPVYNVAPYLRAGLDSVRTAAENQSAATVEIICVDDGSTDGSTGILDTSPSPAVPHTLKVLHCPHRGVSAARNAGLDAATGDLILFADPDDMVAADWIANLIRAAANADLVWTGYAQDGIRHEPSDVNQTYVGDAIRRRLWRAVFGYRLRDLAKLFLPGGLWTRCKREMAGVWRCAVRRETLGGLRFDPSLSLYEDAIFITELATRARRLGVVGDCGYDWRVRPTGAMSREFRERAVVHKFAVRNVRARIDPKKTHWRGTFLLSALEILKTAGFACAVRYLTGKDPDLTCRRA